MPNLTRLAFDGFFVQVYTRDMDRKNGVPDDMAEKFSPPGGFFGVGVESANKLGNLGNLIRSAHAFGANFLFTIEANIRVRDLHRSDTSKAFDALPLYQFDQPEDLLLPEKTICIGVELTEEAIPLPSFRHPLRAAYIFGPERGSLSPQMLARCDQCVKIPTRFCINVATAAAVVFYDRHISLGKFTQRPVSHGLTHLKNRASKEQSPSGDSPPEEKTQAFRGNFESKHENEIDKIDSNTLEAQLAQTFKGS